jgi:DNA repair protein SbcC/Rad50
MRPHRLRLTAFGAFGGTAEVSFDDLAAAGLFLLHGDTGAGKTTLLDAIGFALYGRVPGERGKTRRLRSDHAAPEVPTEVQLEATVGGRRLRITRKPEQTRPKLRGDGFTTEQARILLEEQVRGEWRTVSTRVGEADTEIADLMGMSAEQFFQVVLLPQGQFAQFLHSDAEGRGLLLQRLFGTDRFREVEAWLAERRRTTAHEVAEAEQRIGQLTARVAEVASVPMPDALDDTPDAAGAAGAASGALSAASGVTPARSAVGLDLSEWADRLTVTAAAEAAVADGRVAVAREALDAALDVKGEAERLAGRQRRRAEALGRQVALAAAEPRIAALRGELDAAQRAAEVAPALAAADQAATALAQARTAEARARDSAAGAASRGGASLSGASLGGASLGGASLDGASLGGAVLDAASASAAQLRDAGQLHVQQVGRLEALRSLAEQAAAEDELAASARKSAGQLAAAAEACAAKTVADRKRRDELGAARDAAQAAATQLPAARTEADRYRRAADDAVALAKATTDAERYRRDHLTAREHAVGLREQAAQLREARIDGMRAELAASLTEGAPCPVCGSLDHPELCELRGERVTREQEKEATGRADAATSAAEAIGTKLATAQARIADLTARLAEAGFGDPSTSAEPRPVELGERAGELGERARQLADEAGRLGATASKLDELQAAFERLGHVIADAETRTAELTQQSAAERDKADAATQRAEAHRETLHAQLDGAPDLDAALSAARRAANALNAAADAADATVQAAEAAARTWETARQAAADAGFDTLGAGVGGADAGLGWADGGLVGADGGLAAARAAQRDAGWRTGSDKTIREHEASAGAVSELLADPELDVPLEPAADVGAAAAAADAASGAHDAAVAALARAQRTAEQLAALVPELDARLADFRPLAERAVQARKLADLAAGQGANTLRMTLSSFVLAARLEEVAAAASQRLLRMTAGRYSLVHTDSRRGAGRSGLGLLACDAWTGVDRDTSTLSGGETFMASLALALGLADVVTEESGGARIEALFVDEGFGSLDEDTLEEVMNVLDGLREGGRLVGIVSHVAELRQRVPAQIRVRKSHTGSSVTVPQIQ